MPADVTAPILCFDPDPEVGEALRAAGARLVEIPDVAAQASLPEFDVDAALAAVRQRSPAALVLRADPPEMPQLALLAALREAGAEVPVLVTAERGSMVLAIAAIQAGAHDLLVKPLDPEKLREALARSLAAPRGAARPLSQEPLPQDELTIVGESEGILDIYKTIGRVAGSTATVLIVGESGTGKELVARVTHRASARSGGPFLAVNCAAIPENLLESELFGHEKGAFTGAVGRKIGKFERAAGGTIFLDEIGDMSIALQSKILRVLQDRELERVGGKERLTVDVRIMAATNRDLQRDVRDGRFREDLYFRLAVVTIALPPLRQRRGDIPLLVDHFTRRFSAENAKPLEAVAHSVHALLESHPWPGNIRQLRNALERAVIMSQGRVLLPEHLPPDLFAAPAPPPEADGAAAGALQALEEVEKRHIRRVLEAVDWNLSRAAEILGIHRNTLRRRARELGLVRVA